MPNLNAQEKLTILFSNSSSQWIPGAGLDLQRKRVTNSVVVTFKTLYLLTNKNQMRKGRK